MTLVFVNYFKRALKILGEKMKFLKEKYLRGIFLLRFRFELFHDLKKLIVLILGGFI